VLSNIFDRKGAVSEISLGTTELAGEEWMLPCVGHNLLAESAVYFTDLILLLK